MSPNNKFKQGFIGRKTNNSFPCLLLGGWKVIVSWFFKWGKGRKRQWHPTPVLLPGKSHGRRSLEDCSPWGHWGSDRLSDFNFTFHFPLSCIGEGNGNPLQCSCLENPRNRGAWWAAVYGVAQSWTELKWLSSSSRSSSRGSSSDGKASAYNEGNPVQSLDWKDPLEKEMATHSNILVWKIPWTEEPGRLQSMGLQRVGHD